MELCKQYRFAYCVNRECASCPLRKGSHPIAFLPDDIILQDQDGAGTPRPLWMLVLFGAVYLIVVAVLAKVLSGYDEGACRRHAPQMRGDVRDMPQTARCFKCDDHEDAPTDILEANK